MLQSSGQLFAPVEIIDQLLEDDPSDRLDPVFERRSHVEHLSTSHALLFAVLTDALHILLVTPINRRHLIEYTETLHWFRTSEDTHLYSFLRICDFLHLDPTPICRGIEALLASQKPRPLMRRDPVRPTIAGLQERTSRRPRPLPL